MQHPFPPGRYLGIAAALTLMVVAGLATADPQLRVQVDQRGDFVLLGNSLGWDCQAPAESVLVGTVECSDVSNASDTSQDIYWRADGAGEGSAFASTAVAATDAASIAMLALPEGASVTYARLYWGAYQAEGGVVDELITVQRASTGDTVEVSADASWQAFVTGDSGDFFYQATADITAWVAALGAGQIGVSAVAALPMDPATDSSSAVAGWALVVFYSLDTEPPRNLALFDGFDLISSGNPKFSELSGFLVPAAGYEAKLGVLTYEGDGALSGDQLLFNGSRLSNALNPEDNFFNGTRSFLGVGDHHPGDLPELSGAPESLGGMDIDVVDVTPLVQSGDSSATVEASSTAERFVLGAFVTSISTFKPSFETSGKLVSDIDGGMVRPGDLLEYRIDVENSGNDAAVDTWVIDALPAAVDYIPGSLVVTLPGESPSPLTDASGDDGGEYDEASRTVTARVGAGADAAFGGTVPVAGTLTVSFQVVLLDSGDQSVENQAIVSASGALGAAPQSFATDGNGDDEGAPPTVLVVDDCETDAECGGQDSGRICSANGACAPGCRGELGNSCPLGLRCTSEDATVGDCELPDTAGGAGGQSGGLAGGAGMAGSAGLGGSLAGGAGMAGSAGLGGSLAGSAGVAGSAGTPEPAGMPTLRGGTPDQGGVGGMPSGTAGTSESSAAEAPLAVEFRGDGLGCGVAGVGRGKNPGLVSLLVGLGWLLRRRGLRVTR